VRTLVSYGQAVPLDQMSVHASMTCVHCTQCWSSLKTGPVWPRKTRPWFLKILQQLTHMNLSNYFFRTDSMVLLAITFNLLALYFMHEISETSDVRFMPMVTIFSESKKGHWFFRMQVGQQNHENDQLNCLTVRHYFYSTCLVHWIKLQK